MTHPQLSDALTQLGFQKRVTPQFTAYRNARFGALIVLPPDALDERVRPLHLAAARATVVGKGVATAAEFDRLLIRARRGTAAPSAVEPSGAVLLSPGSLTAVRPKRGALAQKTTAAKKRAKKTVASAAKTS